jgi:hypothetical protein
VRAQGVNDRALKALRAEREAKKMSDLVREVAQQIKSASKALQLAQSRYSLTAKEDIPELIRTRQEVMNWRVRQRVFIEVWELATNEVWNSGTKDE